jgi:Flp pilus assembly protein TadB
VSESECVHGHMGMGVGVSVSVLCVVVCLLVLVLFVLLCRALSFCGVACWFTRLRCLITTGGRLKTQSSALREFTRRVSREIQK